MFEKLMPNITGGMNIVFWGLIAFIIIGLVALVVMLFLKKSWYKKHVEIWKAVGNNYITYTDICRPITDDDGHKWWRRWNEKQKDIRDLPEPPAGYTMITPKGAEKATFLLVDNQYFPIKPEMNVKSIPADLFSNMPDEIAKESDVDKKLMKEKKWKEDRLKQWKQSEGVEIGFHPFNSNQRALQVNSIRRAEQRKQTNWQSQIAFIATLGALVIIVIALLVFYGNIAKPVLDMKDKQIAEAKINQETMEIIRSIKNDIQEIRGGNVSRPVPGGG